MMSIHYIRRTWNSATCSRNMYRGLGQLNHQLTTVIVKQYLKSCELNETNNDFTPKDGLSNQINNQHEHDASLERGSGKH